MGDFIIGLLCTWALSPRSFQKEMKLRFGNRRVLKYDIPPPPANRLEVFFENQQKVEIPLDEIRPLINPGCHTCLDMTSEFADVSVGAAEGFPGWNTVILRSKKGKILFDKLVGKGVIEAKPLPKKNIQHLSEASAMKKKRALNAINQGKNTLHALSLPKEVHQTILNFQPPEIP